MIRKKCAINDNYDYILCDSLDALEYFYKQGLDKKIKVITSSPAILLKKKINSKHLFDNWSTLKYKRFQESIFGLSYKAFNVIRKSNQFEREEAIIAAIACNNYHKFLLKFSQIDEKFLNAKLLFISIDESFPNAEKINPPWHLLSFNHNFYNLKYKPANMDNVIASSKLKLNFLKRYIFGGIETLIYRFLIILTKIFKSNNNDKLFITSENELSIEIASSLFLKGFCPVDLLSIKNNFSNKQNKRYKNLWLCIKSLIKERLKPIKSKRLRSIALKEFENQLFNEIIVYLSWKDTFSEFFKKTKINYSTNSLLITNHACSTKNLAAHSFFKKRKIKMLACQHGVSAEISGSHSYCLSQHDSSSSEIHLAFNTYSKRVADSNPFSKSKSYVSGSPKRYKRLNYVSLGFKKYEVLFLSNALYKGNTGGLSTWSTDLEIAKNELKVLSSLKEVSKNVYYKPYPYSYKRYLEKDLFIEFIKKKKNLKLIKQNYDARYLIGRANILICCTATSTLSWAIMSNKPLLFINFKNMAPIKKELNKIFRKSVFFIDFNKNDFRKNIKEILNKPKIDIQRQWEEKYSNRKELINLCISSDREDNLLSKIKDL